MNKETEPIRNRDDIKKFLNYLESENKRDYLIAKLQLNTGTRISEVCCVKVSDLMLPNLEMREFWDLKQTKNRRIFLNSEIKCSIEKYVAENGLNYADYLFASRRNNHLLPKSAYSNLKQAGNAVGLENFGTHSLRKTWGYWAYIESNYNISAVMEALGQRTEKDTLAYIGISQAIKKNLYDLVSF